MKVLGNARKCYIGDGSGTWISGEQSSQVDVSGNLAETSDKGSTWQTWLTGIKGATANVTCHVDTTDTQQLALLNALTNGSTVHVFIGTPASGSGSEAVAQSGYTFDALVSSVSETDDNGAVASRTFNLTAQGAVTIA